MEQPNRHTTADGTPIYRIPENNIPALKERVAKLNKRAAKLKMDPLVLAEIGEAFETRRKLIDGTDMSGRPRYREYQVRFVLATLVGTCPRVNGWVMAATIQHDPAGNILATVPGFESGLPQQYRTAPTACDHCSTNRVRKDTYVLHSESGDWKQVGRNCLADFLRSENAAGLAEMAEILAGLSSEMAGFEDEEGFGGSRRAEYFTAVDLLTQVACCVRADGWCSRTEAKNSYVPKLATVDAAMSCWNPIVWDKMSAAAQEHLTPTDADRDKAAAAIAWAQELSADVTNDYLWNIRVVSHRERIGAREAGLAGSIVAAYNRFLEQEMARKYERDHPSEYFGEVGKRDVFTLTVLATREMSNDFGLTTLVTFRDTNGSRAKWFCSGHTEMVVDQSYTVKATVKCHEEYKGARQTTLSRVVMYDVAATAQAKAALAAAKKRYTCKHEPRHNRFWPDDAKPEISVKCCDECHAEWLDARDRMPAAVAEVYASAADRSRIPDGSISASRFISECER